MRYERSLADVLGAEQAKGYTRLALLKEYPFGVMGLAKERLNADELIKVAGLGLRELTPAELKRVVEQAARAGFDPEGKERAGGRVAGLVWKGKMLKGSDMLPPGEAHYLRHVVDQKEWPEGTTLEEYYQSLEEVIRDDNSGILISRFSGEWQAGFLGYSGSWRGEKGYNYIWVDYRISTRHWVTGLQLSDLKIILDSARRTEARWLRELK